MSLGLRVVTGIALCPVAAVLLAALLACVNPAAAQNISSSWRQSRKRFADLQDVLFVDDLAKCAPETLLE